MGRESQRIKVEETDRMDLYGSMFAIFVTCRCGYGREISGNRARWKLGPGVTIGQFKAHLRCTQCGERMPEISVFRRPRD
jgi:hypothetical protein